MNIINYYIASLKKTDPSTQNTTNIPNYIIIIWPKSLMDSIIRYTMARVMENSPRPKYKNNIL